MTTTPSPSAGSLIAAIPAVLLAAVRLGLAEACYVALGYLAINVIVGNVLEPRVMGRRLSLSPLVVFVSLVFWGWVLDPVGMLFSVPLTMILKIILEASEEARWLAILLSEKPEAPLATEPLSSSGNAGATRYIALRVTVQTRGSRSKVVVRRPLL